MVFIEFVSSCLLVVMCDDVDFCSVMFLFNGL